MWSSPVRGQVHLPAYEVGRGKIASRPLCSPPARGAGRSSSTPAAVHLLERHFAPGLHEEILQAVGLELGTPVAVRPRDAGFRAAVLQAYLAECSVCGFSLRLVDSLIGVDAAHLRWHAYGGPDEDQNGLALCALHHRLFDHGAITVREDLRLRVARGVAGGSARDLLQGPGAPADPQRPSEM